MLIMMKWKVGRLVVGSASNIKPTSASTLSYHRIVIVKKVRRVRYVAVNKGKRG